MWSVLRVHFTLQILTQSEAAFALRLHIIVFLKVKVIVEETLSYEMEANRHLQG